MTPHTNRRHFLGLSAGVAAGTAIASPAQAHSGAPDRTGAPDASGPPGARGTAGAEHDLRLWYPTPASEWLQALPIGNGRLGAMVFGGVDVERLQLNEDTVWGGGPYDPAHPDGLAALPEIRRLVFDRQWEAAQELIDSSFMGTPLGEMPYQTVGDLRLTFPEDSQDPQDSQDSRDSRDSEAPEGSENPGGPGGAEVADYHRELDLTTAVARTCFTRGGVTHTRETFASGADQVVVVHLTASTGGQVSFSAAFDSVQSHTVHSPDALTVGLDGTGETVDGLTGKVRFRALATVRATGGSVSSQDGTLTVTGADAVTLLVSVGTNRVSYQDLTGDHEARAREPLAVADLPYEELRARHVADYRTYFDRATLDLGSTSAVELPTDQRVSGFAEADDPQLVTLLFQFGRYLLISSSRPGTQPANLQGLWNAELRPPWSCRYTININTEMNYWPAGPTNLIELTEPVMELVEDLAVTGARTASLQYGAGGWVCHHNTDGWRATAPADGALWGMWQTGGAWLALHIWEHYRFTGDLDTLRDRYPALRGAARFFVDSLVEDPDTGYLVTCPSNSPENSHHPDVSVCAGPTMDMQIVRDLFRAVAEASTLLETDADLRERVRALADRLAPTRIGAQGQVQEWQEDWDADAPEQGHRHVSHLYGLHPSNQITVRDTPELAEAARVTLEQRGDDGTGWSLAWKINFWARLEDGARSYKLLGDQLTPERTAPNLFCLHPPFQIDGNFGATAGIAEWLVQSHAGETHLLPALPPQLPAGRATGLRARGGDTIDLTWSDGTLTEAAVHTARSHPVRLRTGVPVTVTTADGREVTVRRAPEADVVTFDAAADTTYRLRPR